MTLKFLCTLGILLMAVLVSAQQRWLTANDKSLQTDGMFTEYPLPNPGSGPTTIALAPDGTLWFTESAGNRIGRMNPDGTGLKEFPLPNPGSSPRIIALGSDGNMWFSEHTGNRMGRIAPDGTLAEFPIPTPNSMPRAIALGSDGNIWFGEFGGGKIGRITPQGVITEFPIPDAGQRTACAGRRTRRQHLVLGVQRQQDRPHHAAGRHHRVRAAAAKLRTGRHHGRRGRPHVVRRAGRDDGRKEA